MSKVHDREEDKVKEPGGLHVLFNYCENGHYSHNKIEGLLVPHSLINVNSIGSKFLEGMTMVMS